MMVWIRIYCRIVWWCVKVTIGSTRKYWKGTGTGGSGNKRGVSMNLILDVKIYTSDIDTKLSGHKSCYCRWKQSNPVAWERETRILILMLRNEEQVCKKEGETIPTLHTLTYKRAHTHISYTQEREDAEIKESARAVMCRWKLSQASWSKDWFSTVAMEQYFSIQEGCWRWCHQKFSFCNCLPCQERDKDSPQCRFKHSKFCNLILCCRKDAGLSFVRISIKSPLVYCLMR